MGYSYASAESDFAGSAYLPENSQHSDRVMVPATLSFASPESDFCGSIAAAYGALDMGYDPLEQFRKKNKKLSFNEAIMPSSEPRVITEATAPFRIVHANEAWNKIYEKNKGILGHSLAMANLKALGTDDAQTTPTNLGSSTLKVVKVENKYLLSVLDGYNSESSHRTATAGSPEN